MSVTPNLQKLFSALMSKIYPLSAASCALLFAKMEEQTVKKGCDIIEAGDGNRFVYFVAEGLTRAYVFRGGKDYTAWFSKPGEPVCITLGATARLRSVIFVEALADSVLLRIARADLEALFCTDLELCNWGRRLADTYLYELEQFFARDLCSTAGERYENLLRESPELFRQVPLKHLASYLLVTPESLSRIRHRLAKETD